MNFPKTKLFYHEISTHINNPIDKQINEFVTENNYEIVDVKITGVNNTFSTQCDLVALLIYKDGEKSD